MSEIPADVMRTAREAMELWPGSKEETIARALMAERERCAGQVCFPADWHIQEDQTVPALLEDIRTRINSGAAP